MTTTLLGETIAVDKTTPGDQKFWSVTTIMNALDRPALTYWAIEQTANAALDSNTTIQAMLQDQGRDDTVTWLCGARWRQPKTLLSDTSLGTAVHKVCETYALTGTRPDQDFVAAQIEHAGTVQTDVDHELGVVNKMVNLFDGWLQRFTPSYQAAEMCVYSTTYGYAGQSDAFLTIRSTPLICDYKTTRKPRLKNGKPKTPYPEVALQLAAYRHADFAALWRVRRFEQKFSGRYYLLSEDERALATPVPEVDGGICILITPESCEAYPIQCGENIFTEFCYVLEAARWNTEISKSVIGEPLQ